MTKKNQTSEFSGKVLPSAVDFELVVLGAILLEKKAITKVLGILQPDFFYDPANQIIYETAIDLYKHNKPIDVLSMTDRLRSKGKLQSVGGAYTLANLTGKVASSANIEYHSRIILEKYIMRRIISDSAALYNKCFDPTSDVMDMVQENLTNSYLINLVIHNQKRTKTLPEAIEDLTKQIEKRAASGGDIIGIPTGNSRLDKMTGGWSSGEMIVLAARPAMGKTARLMNFAKVAAKTGKKVSIHSLEMTMEQLVRRLISEAGEIPGDFLKTGNLSDKDWIQYTHVAGELSELPITVFDNPRKTTMQIRNDLMALKANDEVDIAFIDYLQLIEGSHSKYANNVAKFTDISREIKVIAKELGIPIMALSQLSRKVEERAEKRPQLADLRESGAIEQDADMVIGIYRDSYYNLDENHHGDYQMNDGTGSTLNLDYDTYRSLSELIILKNREGDIGKVFELFYGQYSKFTPLDKFSNVNF